MGFYLILKADAYGVLYDLFAYFCSKAGLILLCWGNLRMLHLGRLLSLVAVGYSWFSKWCRSLKLRDAMHHLL